MTLLSSRPSSPSTDEVLVRAAALPTANIADAQERFGVPRGIVPVWAGARLVGRARTVRTRAGDNLFVHRALAESQPGDVLVVDGEGDTSRALIGDLIGRRALDAGVVGFVLDGAVRDVEELAELRLPVYARAVTPAGPYKHGPGRLDVPVSIGGVVVAPGDLLVGDGDGVVVVPADQVDAVLTRAEEVLARETGKRGGAGGPAQ